MLMSPDVIVTQAQALIPLAAAGWAVLTYLFSGSIGLAILVFIVLKILGR